MAADSSDDSDPDDPSYSLPDERVVAALRARDEVLRSSDDDMNQSPAEYSEPDDNEPQGTPPPAPSTRPPSRTSSTCSGRSKSRGPPPLPRT